MTENDITILKCWPKNCIVSHKIYYITGANQSEILRKTKISEENESILREVKDENIYQC